MPSPGQRWKKAKQNAEIAPVYDEDMGGCYDSGIYSRQTGHPGYFWVNTDLSLEASIQTLRTIAQER